MQRIGHPGDTAARPAEAVRPGPVAPDAARPSTGGRPDPRLAAMQRRVGGRGLGAALFTDIVGSTAIAAEMGNTRWSELVARHHRIVRRVLGRHGGHEIDTAGDGFFVLFERPADAIRCAVEVTEAIRELGIEVRAGVAFGELETVGRKPSGLVVNTAARVMAVAGPGEVLVPASVRDIVPGAGIAFADHGVHHLKGFEEEFRLFTVTGFDGHEVAPPLDDALAAERRREIFPTTARRWALPAGIGVGLVALVVLAAVMLAGDEPAGSSSSAGPLEDAVAILDVETGRLVSPVRLGTPDPSVFGFLDSAIAAGQGGVWVLRPPALLHVDPLHAEIRGDPIDIGLANKQTIVAALDGIWEMTGETVYRVNAATDELDVVLRLPIPGAITTYSMGISNVIWVASSSGTLVRFDPRVGARDQTETGSTIDALAASRDAVWLVDLLESEIVRVDPTSLRPVDRIRVEGTIDLAVADDEHLWLLDRGVGLVKRVDVPTNQTTGSVRVGDDPTSLTLGGGSVWVGDRGGTLFRVDPETLEVDEIPIGNEVLGVAVDETDDVVWVYVGKRTEGS